MVAHPEVRKRAQQEIDDVVGSSRSPSFEDWNSLPYLQAIVQEVSGPFAISRNVMELSPISVCSNDLGA